MGRPRAQRLDWLPKYCYVQRKRIIYLAPGEKPVRLCSVVEATQEVVVKRLAEHLQRAGQDERNSLDWLCRQFNASPQFEELSPATRKAYNAHYKAVVGFKGKGGRLMGTADYRQITTGLLQRYVDRRAEQGSPVAGNREVKGYLSKVYAWALARDYLPHGSVNPCHGVERCKEVPAGRYVEHWEFNYAAVRAPHTLLLWMWLAYLLACRPSEALKLRRSDLLDEGIRVDRLKGSKTNIVKWSPQLAWITDECLSLPGQVSSVFLLHDSKGQPITYSAIRGAWDRLMKTCAQDAAAEGIVWAGFRRHDLKVKGSSDHDTGRITGHVDERMHQRYRRLTELVNPVM